MSKESKKEFEDKFQQAVAASLQSVTASDDLRSRILGRLKEEAVKELPDGIDEEVVSDFQDRLSEAVHRSQDWAPEDEVALRTEARVSQELKENVLSERSVNALVDGAEVPESLAEVPLPEEKRKFVETLRSEVKRSTQELTAPTEVRERVVVAIESEVAKKKRPKLVLLPGRAQWKRGLSALTSLAAGFAIVFITLFSSAEAALATSVRSDHQNCCRMSKAMMAKGPSKLTAMVESKFGPVPVPPVDSSWELRVSQICYSDDNKPMVHQLYARMADNGEVETMSFHFLPNQRSNKDELGLKSDDAHELGKGDFPVIAWLEGDWVCTACSPDMDSGELKQEAVAGL